MLRTLVLSIFINFYESFHAPVKCCFNIIREKARRKLVVSYVKSHAFTADSFFIAGLICTITVFKIFLLILALH